MSKIIQFSFLILLGASFISAQGKNPNEAKRQTSETSAQQKTKSSDDTSRDAEKEKAAVAETERIIAEIVNASYPELRGSKISVKTFHSRSDYFRARFSFARFLTFRRLHFIIFVNPLVFEKNTPAEGIRAIIAHELAHAAYYRRHNRFELFGLINLESKSFTARFERGADLQAIKRGYGAGLKQYREWLYRNVPAEKISAKKRDYFSPEEIELILAATKDNPKLLNFWIKNVPRNYAEIESAIKKQTAIEK